MIDKINFLWSILVFKRANMANTTCWCDQHKTIFYSHHMVLTSYLENSCQIIWQQTRQKQFTRTIDVQLVLLFFARSALCFLSLTIFLFGWNIAFLPLFFCKYSSSFAFIFQWYLSAGITVLRVRPSLRFSDLGPVCGRSLNILRWKRNCFCKSCLRPTRSWLWQFNRQRLGGYHRFECLIKRGNLVIWECEM